MSKIDDTNGMQTLIIGIGQELLALDAGSVREILDPVPTTEVPGSRAFVPGIVNVRGNVIPLVDLRLRFGMAPSDATADTRFVVVQTEIAGDRITVGIVADKVFEVATLAHHPLAETTKMGLCLPPELIRAVGRWRDGIVLVPDIERVLH